MDERVKIGYVLGADTKKAVARRMDALMSRVDTTIDLLPIHVNAAMNIRDWSPADTASAEAPYLAAFRMAEQQGCDAVIPDGMLDLAVDAGRAVIGIPVVAPFQSALHVAGSIGTRIGIIHYTRGFIPQLWASVRRYSMSDLVVNIRPLDLEMIDLYSQLDEVKERLVMVGRKLLDEDAADVLVPTGPGLCPVAVDPEWLSRELNAPVVEGMGAPLQVAASLARLRLTQSNLRWPRKGNA